MGILAESQRRPMWSRITSALSSRPGHVTPDIQDVADAGQVESVIEQVATPVMTSPYQGYVDERSTRHVVGWVWNAANPAERVDYEVVLPTSHGSRVLHHGCADELNAALAQCGVGDGRYGFYVLLPDGISEAERDALYVRTVDTAHRVDMAPKVKSVFEPISYVAADIVDNCNLRCPFCVYDYTGVHTTNFMSDATFDAALRLVPYVTHGNFWLSCLHEATLHPKLVEFIDRVPREYRNKLFYTTNLAKRMPRSYFDFLGGSGVDHLNISVESLVPEIYERMRKGARHKVFLENWQAMLDAFERGSAPPRLRYIIMAYRSNVREIPQLVEQLRREKMAWQIEVRHTYYMSHIATDFRDREFLRTEEWAWLQEQLADYPTQEVLRLWPPDGVGHEQVQSPTASIIMPGPAPAASSKLRLDKASMVTAPTGASTRIPRPFNLRLSWDGGLEIYGEETLVPGQQPQFSNYLYTNVNYIQDPARFLLAL